MDHSVSLRYAAVTETFAFHLPDVARRVHMTQRVPELCQKGGQRYAQRGGTKRATGLCSASRLEAIAAIAIRLETTLLYCVFKQVWAQLLVWVQLFKFEADQQTWALQQSVRPDRSVFSCPAASFLHRSLDVAETT